MRIQPKSSSMVFSSFLLTMSALSNCKTSESKPIPAEPTNASSSSSPQESTGEPTTDPSAANAEDTSESAENETSATADASTFLESTSEDDDDSSEKFDLPVSDIPMEPIDCKENEEENAKAGIFCVGSRPSRLALVDSDGDHRIEVVVTHNNYAPSGRQFYVFEQIDFGLEETAYSPVPYPTVGERPDDPADAHIVALPRAQGEGQDWLGSWGVEYVDAGSFFAAEIFNPTDPQARFLFSEWRLYGDWIPQVARLDQGLAAAYVDFLGQLTVRVRDLQNQWHDPQYYPEHKGWPVSLETGDVNQDGKQDFVIFGNIPISETEAELDQYITVHLGDGHGDFSSFVYHDNLGLDTIAEAKLGDVTGDGVLDAILMDEKKLHVAAGLGKGQFNVNQLQTIDFSDNDSAFLSTIHVADFNRDQRSDVAVSDCHQNLLHILLASPDGELVLTHSIPTKDCVRYLPLGTLNSLDVNGDGSLDLLALGQQTETLRVYFGNGQGLFSVQ